MMKSKKYAAIDIGSNAVRLLIKKMNKKDENEEAVFTKELLVRIPLRLGFDVFGKGEISKEKGDKLIRLMKAYRQLMRIYDVDAYRACATSATRDSKNGKELLRQIKKEAGIDIDVIDGQEEARIIYDNHIECMEDRKGNYMYVDVGGGSTEVNLLVEGNLVYSKSYNIGTIRLLTGKVKDDIWSTLSEEIGKHTQDYPVINIIGSGGNINKLYRLIDEKDKRRRMFPVSSLQLIYDQMKILTPEERIKEFNLKPDRADVIVPASEIFLFIAGILHSEHIYVPEIGLSDGIIDSLYAADKEKEDELQITQKDEI